jgi:hypothetical protein
VNSLALAALIQLQPQAAGALSAWIEESFEALLGPADERLSRGWSVGGVHGGETLVQSRPLVRDPRVRLADDLLRAPSHCTLATHSQQRGEASGLARATITRFQRWIGVAAEPELPAADPAARDHLRREIEAHLPGYLARSRTLGGDRELLVLAALAHLDPASALGKAYVDPSELRRALRQLDQQLGSPPTIHLMISDGRSLGVLHRGGRGLVMQPPILRPARALADTKPQSVALLLALNVDAAVEGAEEVGEGILTISARPPLEIERG